MCPPNPPMLSFFLSSLLFFEIQLNTSDGSTEVYDQTRSTWSSRPIGAYLSGAVDGIM